MTTFTSTGLDHTNAAIRGVFFMYCLVPVETWYILRYLNVEVIPINTDVRWYPAQQTVITTVVRR